MGQNCPRQDLFIQRISDPAAPCSHRDARSAPRPAMPSRGPVHGACARQRQQSPLVPPEIALAASTNLTRLELYLLAAFALTIALGLRYFVGAADGLAAHHPASNRKATPTTQPQADVRDLSGCRRGVDRSWDVLGARLGCRCGPFIVMRAGGLFFLTLFTPARVGQRRRRGSTLDVARARQQEATGSQSGPPAF